MAKYRSALPQLGGDFFMTDGGIDPGSPPELGQEYAELKRRRLKHLNVMGGCCGTDHRHIEHIASACLPLFREASPHR